MRILFFSRAGKAGRFAFYSYYVLMNLKTVRIISFIYLLFSALIRLLFAIYHLPGHNIAHIDDYDTANWISLALSPIFYIASWIIIKNFSKRPSFLIGAQCFVCIFAMFIILSAMRASFFAMYNPRNTLLMYLVGLTTVAVFFTLEYYETICITLTAGFIFAALIPFYQHTVNEIVLNNLASLILLVTFFSISRFIFSYRADNFFKLRSIEEKNMEIETASIIKSEILGIVAHDLRNPLAVIKSAASLLETEEGVTEEINAYIQMINASCDKANAIIHDLIETAQNDFHTELELTDTHINGFLSSIVDEWLKNKKDTVNIRYHDAAYDIYTAIQRDKMQRVLDNLISNALKFSDEDDHIEIKLSDSDDEVFITVEDYGIGIPAEHIPHLFERFSKARRDGLRGESSVGLGLNIVRQIVKKHNGDIVVKSVENNGTSFTISLPKTFA